MTRTELLKGLAALAAGLLLALLLAEIVLRVAGFSYPSFFVVDRQLGHRLRPGARGVYQEEGRGQVQINRAGQRDHEHSLTASGNTFRVAVLGDSYAEALQVPVDSTFWAETGRLLNRCNAAAGRPVEVLNFGASGYSTLQELLQFRSSVAAYKPDLVLLAFLTGNDVRDHSRVLTGSHTRPYPGFVGDSLIVDTSFVDRRSFRIKASLPWRAMQQLSGTFRTLQLANRVMNRLAQPRAPAGGAQGAWEPGLDDRVYVPPPDSNWSRAWETTEKLLGIMADEVKRYGSRFVVVSLSNGAQVFPDTSRQRELATALGVPDLFYPERRLADFAEREGIEYLPLAPALQKKAAATGTYLHGFANTVMGGGHWNTTGHRVAGELIASYLCGPWRPDPATSARSRQAEGDGG